MIKNEQVFKSIASKKSAVFFFLTVSYLWHCLFMVAIENAMCESWSVEKCSDITQRSPARFLQDFLLLQDWNTYLCYI